MLKLSELTRCARATKLRFGGMRFDRAVQAGKHEVVLCFRGRAEGESQTQKRFLVIVARVEPLLLARSHRGQQRIDVHVYPE